MFSFTPYYSLHTHTYLVFCLPSLCHSSEISLNSSSLGAGDGHSHYSIHYYMQTNKGKHTNLNDFWEDSELHKFNEKESKMLQKQILDLFEPLTSIVIDLGKGFRRIKHFTEMCILFLCQFPFRLLTSHLRIHCSVRHRRGGNYAGACRCHLKAIPWDTFHSNWAKQVS